MTAHHEDAKTSKNTNNVLYKALFVTFVLFEAS